MSHTLNQLTESIAIRHVSGPGDVQVVDVVEDSRMVRQGSMFVARCGGSTDGLRFVNDAISRGAVAVISDRLIETPSDVAMLQSDQPLDCAITIARRLYGDPASKLKMIGVTGTNGKTTVCYMVRHLLNLAGIKCGMIGTVEVDDGKITHAAHLTTPSGLELLALMRDMVQHGCDACVMECSSHALDQGRVDPAMFAVAVFTNLTGDHLDYHRTMENYAAAKAKLFDALDSKAIAVVNADDKHHQIIIAQTTAQVRRYSTSDDKSAEYRAIIKKTLAQSTALTLVAGEKSTELALPLVGRHNVANLLAAISAVNAIDGFSCDLQKAVSAMPGVPGRLERVSGDGRFDLFVDYAHTDDALKNVLRALKPITQGRLRVMFGCGGDRDASKRSRMAEVACELADYVVITSDNPRTEEPGKIIDDIMDGVTAANSNRVTVEPDRAAAIERIIRDAEQGDVVLLAGKGHEDYQIIGTERRDFDDRIIAEKVIRTIIHDRG